MDSGTEHNGSATKAQPQIYEQRLLRLLDERLRDPSEPGLRFKTRFDKAMTNGAMTDFQGLLHRCGLLQTTLFALRKLKAAEERKNSVSVAQGETLFQALELVATLIRATRAADSTAGGKSLFPLSEKEQAIHYFDPAALASLGVIDYQRLQLEALQVAALTARYADARKVLEQLAEAQQ